VLPVRDLRAVELPEQTRLDLPLDERRRRHDDVEARTAGRELRLEDLVAVVDVVIDPDARFGRELLEQRGLDIVRPVVDVDDLVRGRRSHGIGGPVFRLLAASGEQSQRQDEPPRQTMSNRDREGLAISASTLHG
jgi:hypothetical protein